VYVEGRRPVPDEVNAHLKSPENVEILKNLTTLCLRSNQDNWADVIDQLRGMLPDVDLSRIKWDTEERKQSIEELNKLFEEKGYTVIEP